MSSMHQPSSQELNLAIATILRDDESIEAADVRLRILKSHPTWRIPERRVLKFVKRQRGSFSAISDDDDYSDIGSYSQQARDGVAAIGGSLVNALGISLNRNGFEALTESTEADPIMTPKNVPPVTVTTNPMSLLSPLEEISPERDVTPRSLKPLPNGKRVGFKDENGGLKEIRVCDACENCIVM